MTTPPRPGSGSERVGVVIVSFNAAGTIQRCLDALAVQTRLPDRIVLVDNASRDRTLPIVESMASRVPRPIEIVRHAENVGFAAANNRAVERLADCDLVATLNPDAFPAPGWLAALLEAARQHPEAGSFASRLMLPGTPERVDGSGDVYHASGLVWRHAHGIPAEQVPDLLKSRPVFSACAAAALYRRASWLRAGGFDERYFCYAEDVDLGFRLQLLGQPCVYVPKAVAEHIGGAAAGVDSAFAVYHGHRNLEWTFIKNMPLGLLVRLLIPHILGSMAAVGFYLTRGRAGSILKAKWDALAGIPHALRQRREIQRTAVIDAAAVLKLIDRSPLRERFTARAQRRSPK